MEQTIRPAEARQTILYTDVRGHTFTVFGDSISKGLYLEEGKVMRVRQSAVSILADELGCRIENCSAFGQTLKKCWNQGHFQRWLEERGRYETPVVCLGGNDCDYDWKQVAADPAAPHRPKTDLAEFTGILRSLISLFRQAGVRPVFTSLPPIHSQRYFDNVISTKADGGRVMQFFCGDVTNIARHQECYSNAVVQTALENGCDVIDIRSDLLLMPDYLSCLSDDGIHPNQRGHEVIASLILRRMGAASR